MAQLHSSLIYFQFLGLTASRNNLLQAIMRSPLLRCWTLSKNAPHTLMSLSFSLLKDFFSQGWLLSSLKEFINCTNTSLVNSSITHHSLNATPHKSGTIRMVLKDGNNNL